MDLAAVKEELDGQMALIGNVSPTAPLLFGTADEVGKESNACMRAGVDVLAPGCGLAPRTPTKNIQAMVRVAKESPQDGIEFVLSDLHGFLLRSQ